MKKNIVVSLIIAFTLTVLSIIFFAPHRFVYCYDYCDVIYGPIYKSIDGYSIYNTNYLWAVGLMRFVALFVFASVFAYTISQIKKVGLIIFIISFICMMLIMYLAIEGYIPGTSVLLILLLPIIAIIIAKIKSKRIKERTDKNEGKNRRN